MRVEFNRNSFSADMDSNSSATTPINVEIDTAKNLFNSNGALILGIISLAISLCNIPLGIFISISTEVLIQYVGIGMPHWIMALFTLAIILLSASTIIGVFSIVSFSKSTKRVVDGIGLSLSIVSFVTALLCLILNIVGIVAW